MVIFLAFVRCLRIVCKMQKSTSVCKKSVSCHCLKIKASPDQQSYSMPCSICTATAIKVLIFSKIMSGNMQLGPACLSFVDSTIWSLLLAAQKCKDSINTVREKLSLLMCGAKVSFIFG